MTWTRCFSSLGCPELPLEDILALAARHGVAAVELRSVGGTVELADLFSREYGTPAKLAELTRQGPVRIAALDASLHLVGATQAHRDQLAAFGGWADGLGIPRIRVFDGGRGEESDLAEAAETMRWWQDLRRQNGWRTDLMVETHDSLFTAARINRFLAVLPGTAILWDSHHTWKKGGEDPVVTWREIRASIGHVHVKDSISAPSARHPFTYVLPGDGEFPIAPLLTALRADGYRGIVSLEWEKLWHPYLSPLDHALQVAADRNWW